MKRIHQNNYWQKLTDHITKRICYTEKLLSIKIEVKNVRQGRARFSSRYISIPFWATRTKEYFVYYIIHELTHLILTTKHGDKFKQKEQAILKRYNIGIVYKKAYPKYLYNYKTEQKICDGLGETINK